MPLLGVLVCLLSFVCFLLSKLNCQCGLVQGFLLPLNCLTGLFLFSLGTTSPLRKRASCIPLFDQGINLALGSFLFLLGTSKEDNIALLLRLVVSVCPSSQEPARFFDRVNFGGVLFVGSLPWGRVLLELLELCLEVLNELILVPIGAISLAFASPTLASLALSFATFSKSPTDRTERGSLGPGMDSLWVSGNKLPFCKCGFWVGFTTNQTTDLGVLIFLVDDVERGTCSLFALRARRDELGAAM